MEVVQACFTLELAAQYADTAHVFISDVRSAAADMDACVLADMQLQRDWVARLQPRAAMLKFRFPFLDHVHTLPYFAGRVHLPVWGGRHSTETRLVVTPPLQLITYHRAAYEAALARFHGHTRTTWYPHGVHGEGLDHCYDCAAEVWVWRQYIAAHGTAEQQQQRDEAVASLSANLSRQLDTVRTLARDM